MSNIYQYFETWKDTVVTCTCGRWSGKIVEAGRESHRELIDFHCPVCDEIVAIIGNPTEKEIRDAAAQGNPEAIASLPALDAWVNRVETGRVMALESPDQLPDIEGERLCFTWDSMEDGDEYYAEIRFDRKVLWRELAFWEGCERFNQVKEILKARYGSRFYSLSPTSRSELYLYGDDLQAPGKIEFR
jgi:hypothetical protein